MEFKELLEDFSTRMGGGLTLTPDESGTVALVVDEMPVTLQHLEGLDQLALIGEIGEPPPADHLERLYRAMLAANHLFAGTGGATISVDTESGKAMLCRVMELKLIDGESFATVLEGFLNTLETWRQIVGEFRGAVENGETKPEDEPPLVPGGFGSNGFLQV